jgi:hypothetical protein
MKKQDRGAHGASIQPASPAIRLSPLEELQQRAMIDGREEPAFFRALLDATVYVHSPRSNDSGRMRFFQFIRPDNGLTVLPFFTDRGKADAVGRTDAKTVALTGRQLFEHTLGATLMLNPNDAYCVLYPEEIAALLETGIIPQVATEVIKTDRPVGFRMPISAPEWLQPYLAQAVSTLPYVQCAYLVETLMPHDPSNVTLLVVLGVEPSLADRAVRAVSVAMQNRWQDMRTNVDMTAFDPADEPPDWVTALGLAPIYRRQSPDVPDAIVGGAHPSG